MPETRQLGGDISVIVESSRRLANDSGHETWSTLHVLSATLPFVEDLLLALDIEPAAFEAQVSAAVLVLPPMRSPHSPLAGSRPAPEVESLLDAVGATAYEQRAQTISPGRLLLLLSERNDAAGAFLREVRVTGARLAPEVIRAENVARDSTGELAPLPLIIARLGRDLTSEARRGELDPVVGRAHEMGRVVAILSRRMKNTPVLVGEPGVGKTAIVEGLAARVAEGRIPAGFRAQRIFALDLALLVAGAVARGQFEERLRAVIREAEESERRLVIFIDEVHMLVGAGASEGGFDAASLLKPAIARGRVSLIGATTPDAYRRFIEKDTALERRFSPVWVGEPPAQEALEILQGVRHRYEDFHQVTFDDEALAAAVRFSVRYISGRSLPDKAIDLIDEAAATAALRTATAPLSTNGTAPASTPVTEADVARVTATMTGVPVGRILQSERSALLGLEDRIRRRFVGQRRAVEVVAEAIRRNRTGLRTSRGPMGAFLFMGPSGVGKTELARRLAEAVFGSADELLRLDMSEYMERHNVARLFGAPPGYVGYDDAGSLTERVRRRPYQVLLFDEIEKAHPDVLNALLQVLDAGRMTDNHGRSVDFRNTLIIMTSNLGTSDATGQTRESRESAAAEALRTLRPEFRNRIDEVVLFDPLTLAEANSILEIYLAELRDTLGASESDLKVSKAARAALLEEGFNELTGARPLRTTLERQVIGPLSRELLARSWTPGDQIAVRFSNGRYRLQRTPYPASAAGASTSEENEQPILPSDSVLPVSPPPFAAVSLQDALRGPVAAASAVERPAYLERDPGI